MSVPCSYDKDASVRLAAAKTMGVISSMLSVEQRQGVFADAFLKLFEGVCVCVCARALPQAVSRC